MNEKINVTKMDGTIVNADIICFIENNNTKKRYLYYTLNEIVGAGAGSTVKIYVSKVKQDNPALDTPITEEDWDTLKKYMGDSLKGVSNPEVKYLPLAELGTPTNVSERAIAMPTSYDYINKQRGLYAQSIATDETSGEDTSVLTTVQEPAATELTVETTPVAPAAPTVSEPVPEPAPIVEPTPAIETPSVVEPTPTVEETTAPVPPITEPTPVAPEPAPVEPAIEPEVAPMEPTPQVEQPATLNQMLAQNFLENATDESTDATSNHAAVLEPIDLKTIEDKYAEMIAQVNKLKEQELEAAKRYNATLELNTMHTEQHTNFVQNDIKENIQPAPAVDVTPTAVEMPASEPTPVQQPGIQEPTPVTPQNIETNWFDMPSNN